jgi:hypothetical protein
MTGVTKSRESGENKVTEQAKREAARTNRDVCSILALWLLGARATGDTKRVRKVVRAQKYLGCRNICKRRT